MGTLQRFDLSDAILSNRSNYRQGSGLLGYVRNSTGAVGRSVNAKLSDFATVEDFGAKGDGVTDDTSFIQQALNSGAGIIGFQNKTYLITAPLTVPYNSGKWLVGLGGLKSTVIKVVMASGYSENGAIEYLQSAAGVANSLGLRMDNIRIIGHLTGTYSICHGVYIQNTPYCLFNNVIIEGFDGAGLLLDKVQDSSFNNLVLQRNGRTSDDKTDNADTTYSPLHLTSSVASDNCNMLRFNDCQFENNNVSPYIYVKSPTGTSPIGISFTNLHAEIRTEADWETMDLFYSSQGGDFEFQGINSDKFRYGFIFDGAGTVKFIGGRKICDVQYLGTHDGRIVMIGATATSLEVTGLGGQSKIVGCTIGNVDWHYPAKGPSVFQNCQLDAVSIDNQGAGNNTLMFRDCEMDSITAATTAAYVILDNCTVPDASVNIQSATSKVIDSGTAAPTTGTWTKGSRRYNNSPDSTEVTQFVCVTSGTPGTWLDSGVLGVTNLTDGVTAPSAVVGKAIVYVDTSDGDLKVIFGDGTIKTLATDTP